MCSLNVFWAAESVWCYYQGQTHATLGLELGFCFLAILHTASRMLSARTKAEMIFYPFLVVDLVTIVPVLVGLRDVNHDYVQFGFFRFTYVYFNWEYYHGLWPFSKQQFRKVFSYFLLEFVTDFPYQLGKVGCLLITLPFVSGGFFMAAVKDTDYYTPPLDYWNCFYWASVVPLYKISK